MAIDDLPLRERKAAQTRLAVLDALLPKLRERCFDDVPVKELCREVGISEPTFFNHFATKGEVLFYFINLWCAATHASFAKGAPKASGVARLYAFYESVAKAMRKHPGVMPEIIGHTVRVRHAPPQLELSVAELRLGFARLPAVTPMKPPTVTMILAEAFELAVATGELPAETDLAAATRTAMALFFGVPAAEPRASLVGASYRQSLEWMLTGLGAHRPGGSGSGWASKVS